MRIPSGKTDVYLYFVAVDATDLKTRETGLSGFTVYRSRNGAAEVAYTTPTITEIDATNMPGVYALLIDEDTTITSGADSEEVCLHITQASMAPVTRTFELYRPIITSGQTITVANGCADADIERLQGSAIATPTVAGVLEVDVTHFNGSAGTFASGRPEVNTSHIAGSAVSTSSAQIGVNVVNAGGTAWGSGAITAASIASNAITSAKIATDAIGAAQIAADAIGSSELAATAASEIATAVRTELTTELGRIDVATSTRLASASYTAPLDAAGTRTAIGLASANLDTQLSTIDTVVDSILVDTAEIGAAGAGLTALGDTRIANLDATVSSRASQTSLNTLDDFVDTEVAAIKTVTDKLDTALELDGAVYRYTTNALEQAPSGAGGTSDWTADERTAIRSILGIPASGTTPDDPITGILDTIRDKVDTVDTVVDEIKAKTDSLTFTVAGQVDSNIQYVNDVQVTGNGQSGNEWGPA